MKRNTFILSLYMSNVFAYSQGLRECIVAKSDKQTIDKILFSSSYISYSSFKKASLQEDEDSRTLALISLLSTMKDSLQNQIKNNKETDQNKYIPYLLAWRLTIKSINGIEKKQNQDRIINEWDKLLLADDEYSKVQIYALYQEWNNKFVNEIFWKQLKETKHDKIVYAICYVLYKNGTLEDERKLWNTLEGEKNVERAKRMMNASNWMRYRLRTKLDAFEPSQVPPTLE